MNPNDKHSLINDIYLAMETTRTEAEMKQIFKGYGVAITISKKYNSEDFKNVLGESDDDILLTIAEDLRLATTNYTNKKTVNKTQKTVKTIFINHAEDDKDIVSVFIQILQGIGISSNHIFCSSLEGYGTPLGTNFEDDTKTRLNANVIVLSLISEKFYNSKTCLFEMGAAWGLTKDQISVVIPPFELNEMKGVFQKNKGIRIDDEKQLDLLKETLESKLNIKPERQLVWERTRDLVLKVIRLQL